MTEAHNRQLPQLLSTPPRHPDRSGRMVTWVLPPLAAIVVTVGWWRTPQSIATVSPSVATESAPRPQSSKKVTERIGDQSRDTADARPVSKKIPTSSAKATSIEVAPDEMNKELEGDWTGYYQGHRSLSVRPDGTATMEANPEGLAATLLASKLTFEVRWSIKNDALEFETVSGVPQDKVNIVTRMYGKKRLHKILGLRDKKLTLLDEDGVTKYEWTRADKREATSGKK